MSEETEERCNGGEAQADDVQHEDIGDPFDHDGRNFDV